VPAVAQIARLAEVKGQRDLLAALEELPDVHAVFVGEDLEQGGAYRRSLEAEAGERAAFLGYRSDIPAILDAVDMLVLPSRLEGLPMVVLEAMAQAKPVVATDVGGTAEAVVDGETGLLVPPGDPHALAEAIRRLIDDPELARRLGEAGRRRVEREFSAGVMTARVLEVLDEAAG
jgi:glycosyltransferase involved in cell wall biosynthesis